MEPSGSVQVYTGIALPSKELNLTYHVTSTNVAHTGTWTEQLFMCTGSSRSMTIIIKHSTPGLTEIFRIVVVTLRIEEVPTSFI